jgi:hypothetical protein
MAARTSRVGARAAGVDDAVDPIAVYFFRTEFESELFCTTPAKKPRTECCCQPVAFITAAMVVPVGERSNSTTRACFELRSPFSFRSFNGVVLVDCGGWAATVRAVTASGARLLVGFGIGILHSGSRGILPPPPKPHLGRQAGGAGSRKASSPGTDHSTALFTGECQSFLDNVIAGFNHA